jgi:endonuclease-3
MPPVNVSAQLDVLKRRYPGADCALHHDTPFQLLAATILSAQCTDERVNQVTPVLFQKYPTPEALARATPSAIEAIIRSTGFFRQKAKSLLATSRALVERHGGMVPRVMEDLLRLRGVARKTANVVLGVAYGVAEGVVVDTHVRRLSRRLGWTRHEDPVAIERDLMKKIPRTDWIWISHALITHGRALCKAQRPLCADCPLKDLCPSAGKT